MLKIARICIANYGHKDATFRGNIIDFRTDFRGRLADSVMLHAPNGNGKTSILSMMLHMFVPSRRSFVQTLQKPHHKFWDYVSPGRPAFFVMELARKEGMLDEARPALVIGSMLTVTTSGTAKEVFFLVEPMPHFGFDDIAFVSDISKGNAINWTNTDAGDWLSGLRNRRDIKFKSTDSINEWKEILQAQKVSLAEFESQVKMASSEGGVEEFLNSGKPGEILDKILSMIIDEDSYRQRLTAINDYLARNEDMPRKIAIHTNLVRVLKAEVSFAEAYNTYEHIKNDHWDVLSKVKGVRQALLAALETFSAEEVSLEHQLKTARSEVGRLEAERHHAVALKEATRISRTRKDRIAEEAVVVQREAELSATILQKDAAVASSRLREIKSRVHRLELARERLRRIHDGHREAMEPLATAGQRLVRALTREINAAEASLQRIVEEIQATEKVHKDAQVAMPTLADEKAAVTAGLIATKKDQQALREMLADYASESADGTDAFDALAAALSTREEEERVLKSRLKSAEDRMQEITQRQGDITSKRDAADRNYELARQKSIEADQRLQHYRDAIAAYEQNFASILVLLEGRPLLSKDAVSLLNRATSDSERRLGKLTDDRLAAEQRKTDIAEAGSFDDEDVRRALEMCRKSGVQDAAPYVKWISENTPDCSTAQLAVESNLDICLGIRVLHEADLDKIQKAFDREKWQLDKPVAVTVVRSIDGMDTNRRENQIILSASTDYAYHEASRVEKIKQIDGRIEELNQQISKAEKDLGTRKDAREAHAELVSQFGYLSELELQNHAEASAMAMATAAEAANEATHAVTSLEVEMKGVQQEVSRLEMDSEAAQRSRENVSLLLRDANTLRRRIPSDILAMEEKERCLADKLDKLQQLSSDKYDLQKTLLKQQVQQEARLRDLYKEREQVAYVGTATDEASSEDIDACRSNYDRLLESYQANRSQDTELALAQQAVKTEEAEKEISERAFSADRNRVADAHKAEFMAMAEHFAEMAAAETEDQTRVLQNRVAQLTSTQKMSLESVAVLKEREKPGGEAFSNDAIRQVLEQLLGNPDGIVVQDLDDTMLRSEIERIETDIRDARHQGAVATDKIAKNVKLAGSAKLAIANLNHIVDAEAVVATADSTLPPPEEWEDFSKSTARVFAQSSVKIKKAQAVAKKLHDDVVAMVIADGMDLGSPQLSERFTSFSGVDEHGEYANRIVELARKSVETQEAELQRVKAEQESAVKSIAEIAREAVRIVGEASRAKIPDGSSAFGGLPIMKLPKGIKIENLRSLPFEDVARSWLTETQANAKLSPKSTHGLCAHLLEMMARRLGRTDFELLLLKPVSQSREPAYEPAHKMTGSGGQTITAALLLNMLANFIRHKGSSGGGCGFIILDNPIGKANSLALVTTQIDVAKAFGLQLISTSGIKDLCIGCYEWIVTFSAASRFGDKNAIAVDYRDNEVTNAHISLLPAEDVA